MMRGVLPDGRVLIGLIRSSVEQLEAGNTLVSPGYDGHGPDVLLVFAETDADLRAQLTEAGRLTPRTVRVDKRRS